MKKLLSNDIGEKKYYSKKKSKKERRIVDTVHSTIASQLARVVVARVVPSLTHIHLLIIY